MRSPRMWGRPSAWVDGVPGRGTIPTHVGKTRASRHQEWSARDDPHACGEDALSAASFASCSGRSPRMWGRRVAKVGRKRSVGTIPTHVGKTRRVGCVSPYCRDDPHACGEDQPVPRGVVPEVGRSPRMWGRRLLVAQSHLLRGTIPTHVGKTVSSWTLLRSSRDDPHACGEDQARRRERAGAGGRSPRMWGRPS